MSADPLVGTWRLVSLEVRDAEGRVTYPLGRDAAGFITYAADGHMAVQFGRAGRAHLAQGDWLAAPDAEIAAAARDYFAYCGTYELRGGEVVHRGGAEPVPQLDRGGTGPAGRGGREPGNPSPTPPTPLGGRQQIATLVWERT